MQAAPRSSLSSPTNKSVMRRKLPPQFARQWRRSCDIIWTTVRLSMFTVDAYGYSFHLRECEKGCVTYAHAQTDKYSRKNTQIYSLFTYTHTTHHQKAIKDAEGRYKCTNKVIWTMPVSTQKHAIYCAVKDDGIISSFLFPTAIHSHPTRTH